MSSNSTATTTSAPVQIKWWVKGDWNGLFGLGTESGTQLVARMLGGVLFALGATLFGARDLDDREKKVRVAVGNAVCDGLITGWILMDAARGAISALGYVLAGLFAINCLSWLVSLRR